MPIGRRYKEAAVLLASILLVGGGVIVHEVRSAPVQAASTAPAPSLGVLPTGASAAAPPPPPIEGGCDIADRGMGDYTEQHGVPSGHLYTRAPAIDAEGNYALLVHFHGGAAVKSLVLAEKRNMDVVTVDRGNGSSAYEYGFPNRKAWEDFIGNVDRLVGQEAGRTAHARRIYLSSWSAGYKAVEEILKIAHGDESLRGLILLDSLHASFLEGKTQLEHGQLDVFVETARRATQDPAFFFYMAHSQIKPAGYASTSDTAAFVLSELGIEAEQVREGGRDQLPQTSVAHQGRFSVRGYVGESPDAHCSELQLLPGILESERVE